MTNTPWRDRLLPGSIVARMTLVLFAGIIVAQSLSMTIWAVQSNTSERERLMLVAQNMGARMGQTLQFFTRLPKQYRHVVLDQLRDMGGTRFFVSVNREQIPLQALLQTQVMRDASARITAGLTQQHQSERDPVLQFVAFADLRILSGDNRMVSLPPKWQRFALFEPADGSPVAVLQLPINDDEWMYLATVFPGGSALLSQPLFEPYRLLSIAVVSLTVLVLTALLVRWVVRPLRYLARQSDALGRGGEPSFIKEQGSTEMQVTIRAFNEMARRIRRYLSDRERFFASISHDFKTPLTRARLRVEMMDDTATRDAVIRDLDNLSMMVKGALQMLKEGAIHENLQTVDLRALILDSIDNARITGYPVSAALPETLEFEGRPLALERLFANLIDNALHYGRGVEITGTVRTNEIEIHVLDHGPGIPDAEKSRVFEPYTRLDRHANTVHVGLGLGIARDLAQLHGGSLQLCDRDGGGLDVVVRLPLSHFVTDRDVA